MKKMIKMSLVAAVAVAGISTTATAKPLEEAIKNVDVSGMVRYRYEHTENDTANDASSTLNDYDMDIKFKSKVNDNVTAIVKLEADADTTTADGDANAHATEGYFSVKAGPATVTAGKQNVPGPFDDDVKGSGLVVTVPVGPVTLAAGHFHNHTSGENALGNGQAHAAAVIAKVGPVNADFWYMGVNDVATFTSLHANAKVGPATIDARHSTGELDSKVGNATTAEDASLTKVVATVKAGPANVIAGFAMTGEDNNQGATDTRIAAGEDNDAKVDLKLFQASVAQFNDATAFLVGATTTMGKTSVGAKYVTVDYGNDEHSNKDAEASELLFEAGYKMSKNFNVSGKYSMMSAKTSAGATEVDTTKSRIEVKYTF